MPLYEYRCPSCGNQFEQLRRLSQADEPTDCPKCEAKDANRVMSAPSLLHGGDGGVSASSGGGGCSPRGGFT